jgi:hypothetical protein
MESSRESVQSCPNYPLCVSHDDFVIHECGHSNPTHARIIVLPPAPPKKPCAMPPRELAYSGSPRIRTI